VPSAPTRREHSLKKRPPRAAASNPAATLAARGAEALRLGRYRDAIEAFKQALRQDPQPQWRHALDQAYTGRARDLAAKGMFKEAAIVLENTRAADGTVAAPLLYLRCLIQQGQLQKAAREVRTHCAAVPAGSSGPEGLAELAAALSLAEPNGVPPGDAAGAAQCRNAAQALQAWREGAPAEAIEKLLATLPLRSAFWPLRLILKALVEGPAEPEKAAGLLARVPADGVFGPFAAAARLAIAPDTGALLAGWGRLSPAQQRFVTAARGLPAKAADTLRQIQDAERRGPAALISVLLRQPAALPRTELRAACVELLVQVPEQLGQVERAFGPLTDVEKQRVLALAAEAKQDWRKAEQHWCSLTEALARQANPEARLAQGVVFRRLADLVADRPPVRDEAEDPQAQYLERSLTADPAHLPTALRLIARYRETEQSREWYRAVDRAMQTFPVESAVLAQAVDAAVARKSYNKAAGFARKLLALDPINQAVRQRMIALQIARARKQMRAARPDLAWKALSEAAEWQRADPEAPVRLAQSLVSLRLGRAAAAQALLQEGVQLAGGGVVGWFRAALEAALMGVADGVGDICGRELDRARQMPPGRDAILAIIGLLGQTSPGQAEPGVSGRILAPLVGRIDPWLRAGACLAWSTTEFVAIAEELQRFRLFEALHAYARQVLTRAPQDDMARFFAIVAEAQGDWRRLTAEQQETLHRLEEQAMVREDFHAAKRFGKFLEGPGRGPRAGGPAEQLDPEELQALLDTVLNGMPKLFPRREIRRMLSDVGRAGAVDLIDDMLCDSPFSIVLTPPQIRQLAEQAVARAVAPGGRH
jgi:tetratricopeptide (TPR) repeat protein